MKDDGTAASKLKPGDVIVAVNHNSVKTLPEFEKAVQRADFAKGIVLDVMNKGKKRFVVLREGE